MVLQNGFLGFKALDAAALGRYVAKGYSWSTHILMTEMVLAIAIIAIVLFAVRDANQYSCREESRPIKECIALGFMLRKFL